MAQANRVFRVFISSTFADLKAERDALQERDVLARRHCSRARRCRFLAREGTLLVAVAPFEPTSLDDAQGAKTVECIPQAGRP